MGTVLTSGSTLLCDGGGAVAAPNISYAGSPFSWTYNSAISAANATNSGGAATSWAVTAGALPTGISLNATTGQLTGTPTLEGYSQTAEITATNGGGSDATTITWSVARAPAISYAGSPFSWTYNSAISTANVTSSAGQITSYAVQSGSLPTGISLNTSTGALTGTPTLEGYTQAVTIRATGPGGTGDAAITWSVARAPAISYAGSPFSWTYNSAISTANVTSSGGQITSYAVQSGSLPTGISLNTSTGALTGTPTLEGYSQAVTIRATGPGGTGDAAITWSVNRAPAIAYTGSPFTWYDYKTAVNLSVTSSAGQVTSYAINSGTLPAGITLNTSTGAITGTYPTALKTAANVVIRATGPGGTGDATINVAVLSALLSFGTLVAGYDTAAGFSPMFEDEDGTGAVTDTDTVGYLGDLSGNGNHLLQATIGNRPTFDADGINSKGCLVSDGADNLRIATFAGGAVSQPLTEFVVVRMGSADALTRIVLSSAAAGSQGVIRQDVTTGYWAANAGVGLASSVVTDANLHLLVAIFNGASSDLRLDGTSIASGNAGTATTNGLSLFARYLGDASFVTANTAVSACGCYSGALDATGLAGLKAWCVAKWGTPA